jgi:hypothetical protein
VEKLCRPVEISGMEGEEIKENDGEGNYTMKYCKNFCKCHSVPQYSNNVIKSYV